MDEDKPPPTRICGVNGALAIATRAAPALPNAVVHVHIVDSDNIGPSPDNDLQTWFRILT